jgi:hypothetical protein
VVAVLGSPTLLLTIVGLGPTSSAAAQTVTFDFDTATPTLTTFQNLPLDQTIGGVSARFSAVSGGFSVQSEASTGYRLSQFSGHYLFPNTTRGSALRIQFSQELTAITLTFATTDYLPAAPNPVVLTAFSATPAGTNAVGSTTLGGTYGGDTFPMGTLNFDFGSALFNRVELRVQSGADATFLVDNVAAIILPEVDVGIADTGVVVVSWRAPSTGFVLQQKADLDGSIWEDVTDPVQVVDGQNQVVVSAATGNGFYRLFHP